VATNSALEDAKTALSNFDQAGVNTVLTTVPAVVYTLRELIAEHERLTTPPSDDEREALGRRVREIWVEWAQEQENPKPSWLVPWDGLSDADREVDMRIGEALAAGFRRQVPITDAPRVVHDAIVAEQKRIASLPDSHKPWTGEQGRAWQNGMSNAARIARATLESL
jgi:hypothetical protein